MIRITSITHCPHLAYDQRSASSWTRSHPYSPSPKLSGFSRLNQLNDLSPHPQTLFCRLVLRFEQPDRHRAVITGIANAKVPPPELSTGKCAIVRMSIDRVQKLAPEYPIDGLRVDTAKRIHKIFSPESSKASFAFMLSEMLINDTHYAVRLVGEWPTARV